MTNFISTVRARGAVIIGNGRVLKVLVASLALAILAGIALAVWVAWS